MPEPRRFFDADFHAAASDSASQPPPATTPLPLIAAHFQRLFLEHIFTTPRQIASPIASRCRHSHAARPPSIE